MSQSLCVSVVAVSERDVSRAGVAERRPDRVTDGFARVLEGYVVLIVFVGEFRACVSVLVVSSRLVPEVRHLKVGVRVDVHFLRVIVERPCFLEEVI